MKVFLLSFFSAVAAVLFVNIFYKTNQVQDLIIGMATAVFVTKLVYKE